MKKRIPLFLLLLAGGCRAANAQGSAHIVVNECSSGPSGWVELLNTGTVAGDLTNDTGHCWFVDDVEGGGAPKVVGDTNTNHPPGSTTCSALGRPATCGVVGPGEHVWVKYAFVNSASADACRFLNAPKSGATCGADSDQGVGGPTASTSMGQCFGRQPDGAGWSPSPVACTQGAPNGGCIVGTGCDDGNACTTGETFSSTCKCTGGTPVTGAACGSGATCQTGTCLAAASGNAASIVHQGTNGLLLLGTIVTPDTILNGELLVVGEDIKCVAASCSSDPAAASATVIQTNGIIFPGLIDTHNHIQFDIFDESDWSPTKSYTNHNQWPSDPRYKAMVDAKQYLNGESHSPVSIGCELLKYGELKGLIAGTTSIVGAAIPENKKCYGTLARTIDERPNGLAADKVQAATLFPSTATADKVCANETADKTNGYLIHISEGVDLTAHKEFQKLFDITTTDGCLFSSKTTIVHGTILDETDFAKMKTHFMGLVWSPRSNVFLYGAGTDLSKTANIPAAIEKGITIALAPDWSIGGSQNILDELRFADHVDNTQWGDVLTPKMLAEFVTKNPAKLLGLDSTLGELAVNRKADLLVISGDRTKPYDALLAATPKSVRLVTVGGKILYGDTALKPAAQTTPACESLDICGTSKFACVAQAGGAKADKLGQTYEDIRTTIVSERKKYDDKNLTQWGFLTARSARKLPTVTVKAANRQAHCTPVSALTFVDLPRTYI